MRVSAVVKHQPLKLKTKRGSAKNSIATEPCVQGIKDQGNHENQGKQRLCLLWSSPGMGEARQVIKAQKYAQYKQWLQWTLATVSLQLFVC